MTVTTDEFNHKPARAVEDADRFEALFHEHWPRVYAALYRILGDRAAAEDMALEVFVRLYRQPPKSEDNLAGWFYRVATNLGLNALRARKRRASYEEEAGRMALATGQSPDPAGEAELREKRQQVRRVLAQMKPIAAQALILRHSGLSYAELAAALNVSPASIGTLLARAEQDFEVRYRRLDGGRE